MPVKITLEEVLSILNEKQYKLLNINDFKNTNSIGKFKCLIHNIEWTNGIRYTLKDIQYCKECKKNKEILSLYEILLKKGFKLNKQLQNQYGEFECLYGHSWITNIKNIKSELSGCAECYRPKITLDMVKNKIKEKNYILLDEENYKNTKQRAKFKCIFNHIWETECYNVYSEKSGCPQCSIGNSEMISIFIMNNLFDTKFYKTRYVLPSKLELDGFNKELNLAIEYNGEQHYIEFKNHFHKIGSLEDQINRDNIKLNECIALNITLIVIPYTYNTFDTIKDFIISELDKLDKYKNIYKKDLDWNYLKQQFYKEFELLKENPTEFDEIKNIIEQKNGICISEKYINTRVKLKIKCKNDSHPIFEMNSNDLKRNRWCKLCAHNAPINNETINNIIKEFNLIIIDDYINSSTTYNFKCNYNHIFTSTWDNMKRRYKNGCRICKKDKNKK
jgi:hypothetical protein